MTTTKSAVAAALVPLMVIGALQVLRANPFVASDPGVRGGPAGAGGQVAGLTTSQEAFFAHGREEFEEAETVPEGIPTPTFGAGLIEAISDAAIEANRTSSSSQKSRFGISGRANRNGNDGTIARFGWKAQNKSLLLFAGEAYNVEMGITNELFQDERDGNPKCQFTTSPNSVTNFDPGATPRR